MTEAFDLPKSPYKFLDYYEKKDRLIFFGRKAETRILLADVAVTRLVVLFAKTGTGKTSIINAGVRPALEERGYATFFIRVKKDPVESARRTILGLSDQEDSSQLELTPTWEGETFADKLENVARELVKPIVLFFDQFEEFFIYPFADANASGVAEEHTELERTAQVARKREFISNLATIYHNPQSRVHVVLSMREEWFVDLDMFRDEIPKIFHNDSNLRLRWFNESQAREAIQLPAAAFGVKVTDEVVDKLISDLSQNDEIEPAQLQIVCDTLWNHTEGKEIGLEDYEKLGQKGSSAIRVGGGGNVAKGILLGRIESEFKRIKDEEQIFLLYAILPKLRTEWDTKYVHEIRNLNKELARDEDHALRDIVTDDAAFEDLIGKLREDEGLLRNLLEWLKEQTGLIRYRKGLGDEQEFVELAHDYLVGSLDAMQQRIKAILPMRLLRQGIKDYRESGGTKLVSFEAFQRISKAADVLSVNNEQGELMFRAALHFGGVYARLWQERFAEAASADQSGSQATWEILRERVNDINDAPNVIDLLVELQTPETLDILKSVLANEQVASYALETLGRKETKQSVELLAEALKYPDLFAQAHKTLERFLRFPRNKQAASFAQNALVEFERESAKGLSEARLREDAGERSSVDLLAPDKGRAILDYLSEPVERPASLETHFGPLMTALTDSRVVLFLGADANVVESYPDQKTEHFPPNEKQIAEYIAETFNVDSRIKNAPLSLARVTQYVSLTQQTDELYAALNNLLDRSYTPPPTHRLLARLPRLLEKRGQGATGQVIITTNYDDSLERAFDIEGTPFDVLLFATSGEHRGRFIHIGADRNPQPIESPTHYHDLVPESRSVIIKAAGGLGVKGPERYVLTEDDFIEQVALSDFMGLVPVRLAARLRRSHFLFLGHSLREWNARVILRRVLGEQQRTAFRSWAVQGNPIHLDKQLWKMRGVDILNVPLERYVSELETNLLT